MFAAEALPDRFYLTGTDTELGKTHVSALLCAAFGYDYWKPVQAGLDEETDSERVARLAGCRVHPERFALKRPASPHAAAYDEGIRLRLDDFALPEAERLLVEGAGGYQVPYAAEPTLWQGDLIRHLALPAVVVARSGLGTLNHSITTLRAMRQDGLTVAGMILVGDEHLENARDIAAMGEVPVLGRIPWFSNPEVSVDAAVQTLGRGDQR